MQAVRFDESTEMRLNRLAKVTHRSKSHYMKAAMKAYLDAYEDILLKIADYQEQLQKGTLKTYTLDEMMKKHDLD